jgi:hypothetical protein
VAVVENRTTGNVGNNGETQFYYVMMKMLPDANGTTITSFSTSTPISYKFRQDMSATNVEQMTDLSVLVFVQNNSTKEVLQSTWSTQSATGMEEADGNGIIALFPNPGNGITQLGYQLHSSAKVELIVMNTLGETLIHRDLGIQQAGVQQASFDAGELAGGLYLVNLVIDNKVYTKKLNVR